jgi:hypothetical protein
MICGVVAWMHTVRARRPVLCLVAVVVLAAATYLGLHSYPILYTLLVAAGFSLVTTTALVPTGTWPAKAALAASALLLLGAVLEAAAPWLLPAGTNDADIGAVSFSGRVEQPDPEAERQLMPLGQARHRKVRLNGQVAFDVEYHTDRLASRVVPGRPDSGIDWYLFGDSFTFGEGLADDQTFAAVLQQMHPEARIFDFGMRGTGPSDAWLHLRRRIAAGEAPGWTVYSFIYDHFRRAGLPDLTVATEGDRPRVVISGGKARLLGRADLTVNSALARLRINLLARSSVYRLLAPSWSPDDKTIDLVAGIGSTMNELIESKVPHGHFLFAFLPTVTQLWAGQTQQLRQQLEERHVAVLDCGPRMMAAAQEAGLSAARLYLADQHPSADYARLAGGCISEYVRTQRP